MIKNFLFGFRMIACIFIWAAVVGLGAAFFGQLHPLAGFGYLGVQLGILAGFLFAFIFREEG